jgi:Ser/Thr protein kinase RdoA (MazF antagonist)
MDRTKVEGLYRQAAGAALDAFGIEPSELTYVGLSENVAFRVADARDGSSLVLRLHRPWYHSLDELKSERVWTRALTEAGVGVPEGLRTPEGYDFARIAIPETGETRWAGLARWIEGEPVSRILARDKDPAAAERRFFELGSIMAGLHAESSGWTPPPGFTRHALDEHGLMGESPWWGRFWTHQRLSEDERRILLGARDRLRAALEALGKSQESYFLIHADLHPDNIVALGDRSAVIDFDDCGFGWRMFDVAVALLHTRHRPDYEPLRTAFVAGYRTRRPLPDDELDLLPMFQLVRRMSQIGWLGQRPEHSGGNDFVPWKESIVADAAAFKETAASRSRAGRAPPATLAEQAAIGAG